MQHFTVSSLDNLFCQILGFAGKFWCVVGNDSFHSVHEVSIIFNRDPAVINVVRHHFSEFSMCVGLNLDELDFVVEGRHDFFYELVHLFAISSSLRGNIEDDRCILCDLENLTEEITHLLLCDNSSEGCDVDRYNTLVKVGVYRGRTNICKHLLELFQSAVSDKFEVMIETSEMTNLMRLQHVSDITKEYSLAISGAKFQHYRLDSNSAMCVCGTVVTHFFDRLYCIAKADWLPYGSNIVHD